MRYAVILQRFRSECELIARRDLAAIDCAAIAQRFCSERESIARRLPSDFAATTKRSQIEHKTIPHPTLTSTTPPFHLSPPLYLVTSRSIPSTSLLQYITTTLPLCLTLLSRVSRNRLLRKNPMALFKRFLYAKRMRSASMAIYALSISAFLARVIIANIHQGNRNHTTITPQTPSIYFTTTTSSLFNTPLPSLIIQF
jgi:hypothetical protein